MNTPAAGIMRSASEPAPQSCDVCGQATPNRGVWGYPDYRCRNYDCPACPFERTPVDTSVPVVKD